MLIPNTRRFRRLHYTAIPNEVIDELMPTLSGAGFKVLTYICRRTFGFQRESASISIRDLCTGLVSKTGGRLDNGCGLSKNAALAAVAELEKAGLIVVRRRRAVDGQHLMNTYTILFQGDDDNAQPLGGDGLPAEEFIQVEAAEVVQNRDFGYVARVNGVEKKVVQKSNYIAQKQDNGVVQKLHYLNREGKKGLEIKSPLPPVRGVGVRRNKTQNQTQTPTVAPTRPTRVFRAPCSKCEESGVTAAATNTPLDWPPGTLEQVRLALDPPAADRKHATPARLCDCPVGQGWAVLLEDEKKGVGLPKGKVKGK